MKTAPTPLLSNAVLRTNSESKPRCPEQPSWYGMVWEVWSSAYNFMSALSNLGSPSSVTLAWPLVHLHRPLRTIPYHTIYHTIAARTVCSTTCHSVTGCRRQSGTCKHRSEKQHTHGYHGYHGDHVHLPGKRGSLQLELCESYLQHDDAAVSLRGSPPAGCHSAEI